MQKINTLNYPIFTGDQSLNQLDDWLQMHALEAKKILLVDSNTLKHCVPELLTAVPSLDGAEFLEVDPGEHQKNIEVATQLWLSLSELNLDRSAVLINVGGGVVGDLGGFVAASYQRGIRFVQIPTSLLAMVDASVGGKVGIDLRELKNQVGFFAEPAAVVVYPDFLSTLPDSQIKSGYAEMLKHGFIADQNYLLKLLNFKGALAIDDINYSIAIKAGIVSEDFKEASKRKWLNFGHTFGHAIESYFLHASQPVLHGIAIVAGMICELMMSVEKLGFPEQEMHNYVQQLLRHYPKLPLKDMDIPDLINLMKHDKKNVNGEIRCVGLKEVGNPVHDVPLSFDEAGSLFKP